MKAEPHPTHAHPPLPRPPPSGGGAPLDTVAPGLAEAGGGGGGMRPSDTNMPLPPRRDAREKELRELRDAYNQQGEGGSWNRERVAEGGG